MAHEEILFFRGCELENESESIKILSTNSLSIRHPRKKDIIGIGEFIPDRDSDLSKAATAIDL
jgi:hypothetical protein